MFNFNDLPWHDAELKKISIIRTQNDPVEMHVKWPNEKESLIIFNNCYGFSANFNFGILPPDFILKAEQLNHTQELFQIKNIWKKMQVDLDQLSHYKITTNSTNSTINIFSLDIDLHNFP